MRPGRFQPDDGVKLVKDQMTKVYHPDAANRALLIFSSDDVDAFLKALDTSLATIG